MITSDIKTIKISEVVSPDLALRDTADYFFNMLESIHENKVIINFVDVVSISRSFAHEYISRKTSSKKTIDEINMPQNVDKMFNLVKNPNKPKFIDIEKIAISSL